MSLQVNSIHSELATDSADPHVRAFCDPNTPEIFRSVAYPTDVWTPDQLDVESIHASAREMFDRLLNSATAESAGQVGRILLMLGQSGAGKTHLLRSLRTRTHSQGDGYFGYLQMTSLGGNYSHYVLQKLIASLDKPYYTTPTCPDETTGLMRLSASVAENPRSDAAQLDRLREEDLPIGEPARIALELTDRITESSELKDCNPDLLTALLLLQSGQNAVRKRAIKYLRGERLNDYDSAHLGGLTAVDADQDAIEMIVRLGQLAWATRREALVICVDQLEDIWNTAGREYDPTDRFRTAATTLNQIVGQIPNAIVVLACLDDFYETVRDNMTRPILDRFEQETPQPVTLKANMTAGEARQIAAKHLEWLYDHVDDLEPPANPVHPIPEPFIENLANKSTRDVLAALRRFRDLCMRTGAMTVPPTEKPESPPPTFDDLETRWNDFREDESNAPPDDDASLTKLLESAVHLVNDELDNGHEFHSDSEACDLRVRGPHNLLGRVCNKAAQGGALGKQVAELLTMAENDETESWPALIRSSDYRPTSRTAKIYHLLARLAQRGGRKVIVSDADWRAMAAMKAFRQQHHDHPRFEDWLRQSRPLSRLKSLRDLLRLDELPESSAAKPDEPESDTADVNASDPAPAGETAPVPDVTGEPNEPQDMEPQPSESRELAPPMGSLRVGRKRSRSKDEVLLDVEELKRHSGILGTNGSGKTMAALNLIEQLLCQDVPVLMIDRKGDLAAYATGDAFHQDLSDPVLADRQEILRNWCDVAVYTPGQPEGRAVSVPIAPERMSSLNSTDRYMIAVRAAASLGGMLGYRDSGRDASRIAVLVKAIDLLGAESDERITLESLIDFIAERDDALLAELSPINPRVLDRLLEDLQTLRITKKLLFTEAAEPLSAASLFGLHSAQRASNKTRLSIISLKFIPDKQSNLFWVSQLLLELSRWMSESPSDKLQGLVMFDEADLYLPATSKPPTKEPMENLLKRARAAGLGLMLATQSPGDLDYRCRDNVNTWLLGKISENNAIRKMSPLLEECPRDVGAELTGQSVGQFFLVNGGNVTPVQSDRSVVDTRQMPESKILSLAADSRPLPSSD